MNCGYVIASESETAIGIKLAQAQVLRIARDELLDVAACILAGSDLDHAKITAHNRLVWMEKQQLAGKISLLHAIAIYIDGITALGAGQYH